MRSRTRRPRGGSAPPPRSAEPPQTTDGRVEGHDTPVDAALISLGQLVNVHATHGELRMFPFNPDSTTVYAGCTVVLRRGVECQNRRVTAVRRHKRFLLLTLEGCTSMTAAEALVGHDVCVPVAALPPAGPGEIYYYQLVGMTVVTTTGAHVGVVAEVFATPSNDVCVVHADGLEHLIPLVANVVKEVDREHLRLVIDPVPGLLDG